jgi:WD40 repeat protein
VPVECRRVAESPRTLAPLFKLQGHYETVTGLAVLAETGELISCSEDGSLIFWDYVSREAARKVQHKEALLCLAPRSDRSEVLVGSREGNILRFPLHSKVRMNAQSVQSFIAFVLRYEVHLVKSLPSVRY